MAGTREESKKRLARLREATQKGSAAQYGPFAPTTAKKSYAEQSARQLGDRQAQERALRLSRKRREYMGD